MDIDRFYAWLARKLPKRLRYWATIQSCVEATTGEYRHTVVTELTVDHLLARIQK